MTLKKFDDEQATDYSINNMYNECLSIAGLNLIRQLIDRDIDFSVGLFDWFADAYIDSDGREGSVTAQAIFYDTATTTYLAAETLSITAETTHDPNSFTNPSNAFDGDDDTAATKSYGVSSETLYLGKLFTAATDIVTIKIIINTDTNVSGGGTNTIQIENYNGSSWDSTVTLGSDVTSSKDTYVKRVNWVASEGVRVKYIGDPLDVRTLSIYAIEVSTPGDLELSHTIPTGTFSTTMTTVIGVPFIEDYEAGIDIKYKLTGTAGAEDTGWLDCGITPEVSSFTAFTAEPDTLIVKLVPKTTSPTSGYPSIKGFSLKAT